MKLNQLLNAVDENIVADIVDKFEQVAKTKNTIYIIGNGGSAATASHWTNDFSAGLKRRGILSIDIKSLADNVPVCTAIANDIGYENIFKLQLQDILTKDDIVFAISCSGTSPNIINAVKYAREVGATIIGATGFDGGELMKLSDIKFHVQTPAGEYGLVEDVHMILDHIIYSYYMQKV
ncbi:SIS domain-containing protein [Campylobacter jejuni]|uniref:SIS domain-containing protein n=3 Tax=Campylobacter jejuni TaxID=197 RepID=A0AAW5EFI4_CAMJU|nr:MULTISPECIES: SIS domain-containing protein [Campylobacter]EAI2279506.1 SIS domain-containing protein [Campylobacter jejuni]KAJ9718604.1 SIS domain-containing protein [Campylobacter jejuni]KAJ9755184.1 SIS domain-containing protein [Campylobacter jejuni]KAJ9781355.1 SIS domain-containing protein [Campylobacter jejuni]KAJ9794709.1 SIS domain-containing protein [Campylobacter jejuni]